ncbi:MAG: autotransporter outer membrane beta-barrel domain-containing protein [bacterium]|nr:autotransporter outer membrane beta-barrel domain-containing protein [bacterium]
MFLILLIITFSDNIGVSIKRESIEDKWQIYIIGDLGSYSKFNLKELGINVPINEYSQPLRPTAITGYIAFQKNRKALLFGIFGFSNEALYIKPETDTIIEFNDLRIIGQYELWTNKRLLIAPKLGAVWSGWKRCKWDEASGKSVDKEGKEQVGLLAGTNFRAQQEVSPQKKWTPFIEGTYEYSTPFSGVNRVLIEGGVTFLNIKDPRGNENGITARMDVGVFKGYIWGTFIEGQEQGIGFKIWFMPKGWF